MLPFTPNSARLSSTLLSLLNCVQSTPRLLPLHIYPIRRARAHKIRCAHYAPTPTSSLDPVLLGVSSLSSNTPLRLPLPPGNPPLILFRRLSSAAPDDFIELNRGLFGVCWPLPRLPCEVVDFALVGVKFVDDLEAGVDEVLTDGLPPGVVAAREDVRLAGVVVGVAACCFCFRGTGVDTAGGATGAIVEAVAVPPEEFESVEVEVETESMVDSEAVFALRAVRVLVEAL